MPTVTVSNDKCKGCELCVVACPQQIIRLSDQINVNGFRYAEVFDKPRCIGCRLCALSCPDLAIEVAVWGTQYRFFNYDSSLPEGQ